ncbi:MAG: NAD(P)-dependent oxidoreductase [Actinomycetota bacterium]|nr:NAD(P)-dependent oxidoreductase [Actinomycetota bacterium]
MKVFVAGATGAVGRHLVPLLVAGGHEVVGLTRSPNKAASLRQAGAEPVVADGLDGAAVERALMRTRPDVVIHQMTGLTGASSFKKFDDEFASTNALRTRGTDILLEAARRSGARRFIAQSFGGWNYERTGSDLKTEEHPLDPSPPLNQSKSLDAIRHLERAAAGAEGMDGIALRYGFFYGPGTSLAVDGDIVKLVLKRRLPIVGDGGGVWSFVHIEDAASAAIAAVEGGSPGIYNIVDDEPAPVAVWLPELARVLGAKPPRRIPVWLGRVAIGEVGISMMTQIRGMSSTKANRELGWRPTHKSWRDGFRTGLGNASPRAG